MALFGSVLPYISSISDPGPPASAYSRGLMCSLGTPYLAFSYQPATNRTPHRSFTHFGPLSWFSEPPDL